MSWCSRRGTAQIVGYKQYSEGAPSRAQHIIEILSNEDSSLPPEHPVPKTVISDAGAKAKQGLPSVLLIQEPNCK